MMPLPDVYCLFNRARGAELISPDDLLTAVKLLPTTARSLTSGSLHPGCWSCSLQRILMKR